MASEPETIEEIRITFMGIWNRMERYSPDDRAMVLWALNSDWCMGCGKPLDTCLDCDEDCCCGVELVKVTRKQCPKCDMMRFESLREPEGDGVAA